MARKLTDRELSTILHALRVLQGDCTWDDDKCIAHFEDVLPLNTVEIDYLCEDLNSGEFDPAIPVIVVDDGSVDAVLGIGATDFYIWDWCDFNSYPCAYYWDYPPEILAKIKAEFHPKTLRQIEEKVAREMAEDIEARASVILADPFHMVPAC